MQLQEKFSVLENEEECPYHCGNKPGIVSWIRKTTSTKMDSLHPRRAEKRKPKMARAVKEVTVMKENEDTMQVMNETTSQEITNEGQEIGLVKENEDTMQVLNQTIGQETNEGQENQEKESEPQKDQLDTRPKKKGLGRAAFFSYTQVDHSLLLPSFPRAHLRT